MDRNSGLNPSSSSPDFLREAYAVFKRHRPLGTIKSNVSRASRILVQQTEPSNTSTSSSSLAVDQVWKAVPSIAGGSGANLVPEQKKVHAADQVATLLDSSLTATATTGNDDKVCAFVLQKGDAEMVDGHKLSALSADCFSKENAALLKVAFHGTQVATNDQYIKQHDNWHTEFSETNSKFGGTNLESNRKEQAQNQHCREPTTRSCIGSSCATTFSLHSGPTFNCSIAPAAGQTETPYSLIEMPSVVDTDTSKKEQGAGAKENDIHRNYKDGLHITGKTPKEVDSGVCSSLPSQKTSKGNTTSNVDLGTSRRSNAEKASQRKKYDSDVFFKVSGKLFQKLGKIGSGGSSEVFKVISSDCTIYALKRIKLKGRDYQTAYGFCQEIEYLKKLRGKNNIIQLVDYEVTDESLLDEVASSSMSTREQRFKDDACIYMVLEYGEIDLAHMLLQKWKDTNFSTCKIDENWLRFYWQQMLEAVNTIHEERIVHSDLKPANFLLVKGFLKLIDFGIAKAIMSDTTNIQRDSQVGTLNYMSPEAFLCNETDAEGNTVKCGRPSDIWSLGCILYQMVHGKTPFADYKTVWSKVKVITNRNHKIVYEPLANPWLVDLMQKCLAWDRNERWRIPQLLQHPFLLPQIPREISTICDSHPCKLLMDKLAVHMDDTAVSRLCSQLHEMIANLERRAQDPSVNL